MKLLLTGGSGFFGQVVLASLTSFNITTIGRREGDLKVDLSNSIPQLEGAYDLVIHAAGKAHSIPKAKEKLGFFNVNVTGTANLLKGLEQLEVLPKSFVFISTVAVYGLDRGENVNEFYPLNAKDSYGQSKIQAEKLVQDWCAEKGVIGTILRLPLLAGPNPPGNLKSMIKGIQKGFYFDIAGGQAHKSVVLAKDVAKIIPKVAELGGIYNLTDSYHPTFAELSKLIAQQLGKNKPRNVPFWLASIMAKGGDFLGSKAPINSDKLRKITSNLTFDDSKARQILGWNPTPVLEGFKVWKLT